MEDITIALPSSASAKDFPNNTNSVYNVRLARRLELPPERWQVGLKVAHIPNRFYNVTIGAVSLWHVSGGTRGTRKITIGYYSTTKELVDTLNALLSGWTLDSPVSDSVSFVYDPVSKKTSILIANDGSLCNVAISEDLQDFLGFDVDKFSRGPTTGTRTSDPYSKLGYLMVYSNLVKSRLVGDTMAPLLRTIPVEHGFGDAVHEFKHIEWAEAAGLNTDVIEVNIMTDTGDRAPFVGGKVLLTIQLRERRHNKT